MLVCCDDCGRPVEEFETFEANQLLFCEDCFFDCGVSSDWFGNEFCPGCGCPPSLNRPARCPICGLPNPDSEGRPVELQEGLTPSQENSKCDISRAVKPVANRAQEHSLDVRSMQSQNEVYRKPGRQVSENTWTHSSESSTQKTLIQKTNQLGDEQGMHGPAAKTIGDSVRNVETTNNHQAKEVHAGKKRQESNSQIPVPPVLSDETKQEKHGRGVESGCLTGIALLLFGSFLIVSGLTHFIGVQDRGAPDNNQPTLKESTMVVLERKTQGRHTDGGRDQS